jgi:hypothetical protein
MPKPMKKDTTLLVQIPRDRIIRMSISGTGAHVSATTQTAASTAAVANRHSTLVEDQPQLLP